MVDVTVDQKPMAQLPYDPATIPEAVRKRVAAVEAMYGQPAAQPEQPIEPELPFVQPDSVSEPPKEDAPTPQTVAPVVESSPGTVQPASADLSPKSKPVEDLPNPLNLDLKLLDPNDRTWQERFLAMQGRYTAAQKTIGEMQEQMTQLGNELLQTQRAGSRNGQTMPPKPPPVYLTEQDVQNYGSELVDFAQRAAVHAVSPHLQRIEAENAQLREQLAREARRGVDQQLDAAVPNWREIDRDPRWHRWLLSVDLLSGRVRQQLLDEAKAAAHAPRVISFFRGFLQEEQATGHIAPAPISEQAAPPREAAVPLVTMAAPGRARPATGGDASVPLEKPIYTRAQVRQLYEQHRRGAYVGREAEWARQDADIIAAGREGRIR